MNWQLVETLQELYDDVEPYLEESHRRQLEWEIVVAVAAESESLLRALQEAVTQLLDTAHQLRLPAPYQRSRHQVWGRAYPTSSSLSVFSNRTYNCLVRNARITELAELRGYPDEELLKWRNLGPVTLAEIRTVVPYP